MSDYKPPLGAVPTPSAPPASTALAVQPLRMADRGLALQSLDDIKTIASEIIKSGLAPKSYTRAEQVVAAVMMGRELGLPPMASLRTIAVIHGTPSVWGKGSYALAMEHPCYQDHEVTWQEKPGEPETELPPEFDFMKDIPMTFRCICRVWRKGKEKPFTQKFSVNDARAAGLWMMTGGTEDKPVDMPWKKYWSTMLYHKAVGNAFEMAIPEAFIGLVNASPAELKAIAMDDGDPDPASPSVASFPTAPITLTRPAPAAPKDDVIDAQAVPATPTTPDAIPEKPATTRKKKVETQEIDPQEKSSQPAVPSDAPSQEKPKKLTVNQLMAEFRENRPEHAELSRMTQDDKGQRWVKCECGASYKVDDSTSVPLFLQVEPGNGTCEGEEAPASSPAVAPAEPKSYVQTPCPGLSATHQSLNDEICSGTKSEVADCFDLLKKKLSNTKVQPALGEIQWMVENAIVRRLSMERNMTGITLVAGWINDVKSKMPAERIEALRLLLSQAQSASK